MIYPESKGYRTVSLFEYDGRIKNKNIFLAGGVGSGKTMATESFAEEYHNKGYLVIVLTEKPRGEFDFGYACMEPTAKYHLDMLKKVGKTKKAKSVKFYHFFTENYLKEYKRLKKLPKINWYRHNIKEMDESDFSFVLETSEKAESVSLLLNSVKRLKDNDILDTLLYNSQKMIDEGTYKKKKPKPDFKNFGTNVGHSGKSTDIKAMVDYFSIFKDDNMIGSADDELILNIDEILQDQINYHIFFRKFAKHNKSKYYDFMRLSRDIFNHIEYCKYPVLIILEEVRFWFPDRPRETYIQIASEKVRGDLSTLRSNNVTTICNSQTLFDMSPLLYDSFTDEYYGKLATRDIDRLCKSVGYGTSVKNTLTQLPPGRFLIRGDYMFKKGVDIFPPCHAHAEEGSRFINEYGKFFPLLDYSDFFKYIKQKDKLKLRDFKDRVLMNFNNKQKEIDKEEKDKLKPKVEKVKEVRSEVQDIKKKTKEEKMKMCYEFYYNECDMNASKVSKKLLQLGINISDKTIKEYAVKYKSRLENESALPKIDSITDN